MPVFGKEVYLHLTTRQFHCANCQRFFYESFSFVEPKRSMTLRLEKYLYQCCQDSAFKEVAARENVLWDVLQGLFTRWAKRQIKTDLATPPTRLGIDEFAYCKGKKDYAVVIVDLDRAVVYDVLENRDKETLIAYFKAKGVTFCAAITLFSYDMWRQRPTVRFCQYRYDCFPQCGGCCGSLSSVRSSTPCTGHTPPNLTQEFP